MKKYGIGVIGVGVWGCHSLELELAATGRAEIKAIAAGDAFGANCHGPNLATEAEAYAAKQGAELVSDWRELLARPDIDIVSVMACPKVKSDIIVEALKHGRSVVTDKPLALDVAGARRILDAERNSTGRGLMLAGYHRRPGVARVAELVRSGALGDLKALSIRLNFMGGVFPGFKPDARWRSEIPSGEMTTIGSHAIITAMKIAGRPLKRVYAVQKNDFHDEYANAGAEDFATLNLQFETGVVANISTGRLPHRIPGEDILLEATGSIGYACLRGPSLEIWPGAVKEDHPVDPRKVLNGTFDAFLDALEGRGEIPVTFSDGLALQKALAAGLDSSANDAVAEL